MKKIIKEYKGYDPKIDAKIEADMKKSGYELTGSGYNFRTKKRDLVFEFSKKIPKGKM